MGKARVWLADHWPGGPIGELPERSGPAGHGPVGGPVRAAGPDAPEEAPGPLVAPDEGSTGAMGRAAGPVVALDDAEVGGPLARGGVADVAESDEEMVLAPAGPVLDDQDNEDDGGQDDEDGESDDPSVDRSDAVRVRGWAGRGPVGLRPVKPPKVLRSRAGKRGPGRGLARWLVGREWSGLPQTNATFLRAATTAYNWGADSLPRRSAAWPQLVRATVHWAELAALVAVGVALWRWPQPTLAGLWLAAAAVLYVAGWWAADAAAHWGHQRKWVEPLHLALAPVLGYPSRTPPRRYLWVPRGFAKPGAQVEVALPADFVAGANSELAKKVVGIVRTKLGLRDVVVTWHQAGRNHFLVVRKKHRKPVPARASFAASQVKELYAAAKESAPLLGLGSGGEAVAVDLDDESPHSLISVGTGGGKSVLVRSQLAHFLHHGAEATVLDIKRQSHRWARGLVHYCRDLEEMHLALVKLAAEGERRNKVADDWDGDGEPWFRRHVLVVEEANATVAKLQLWWQFNRRRIEPEDQHRYGPVDQAKSPAVLALNDILYMGRQTRINVILVAQLATAQALGGPAVRECFTARILGRCTSKAWGMLAPEIQPAPASSRLPGRMHVVHAGKATEIQTLWLTEPEARSWSVTGRRGPASAVASRENSAEAVSQGSGPRHVASRGSVPDVDEAPAELVEPDQPELVSLGHAAREGIVTASYDSLRAAVRRDPEFPQPARKAQKKGHPHLYNAGDLQRWESNKPSTHKEEIVT